MSGVQFVVLLTVCILVYGPARELFFHTDDFAWLLAAREADRTPGFVLPADVNGHFRPLVELYWLISYRAFGLDPRPYHQVAIVLHAMTALFVGRLASRLSGGGETAAFVAGAMFAVGFAYRSIPLWISSAPDQLLCMLVAAGLTVLLRDDRGAALGAVALTMGLLAKESGYAVLLALPLLAPAFVRKGVSRIVLLVAAVALLVPHALAFALSSYASGRFDLGAHLVRNLAVAISGVMAPWSGSVVGVFAVQSPPRVAAGLLLFAIVVALAARRLGRRRAVLWAASIAVVLALPSLSTDRIEPRWLYLPWVLFAPLAAVALLAAADLVRGRLGHRPAVIFILLASIGHVTVHGALLRAKIARTAAEQQWTRGVVEGAGWMTPRIADGEVVEVVVPYGSELRYWPLGVALAVDRDVEVRPIDDRTMTSEGVTVLDATVSPARWRHRRARQGRPIRE